MKIAIIGAGAAGFFAAINCRQYHPESDITIFEKSSKLLAKVKISGGGRCNVTNNCHQISELLKSYPRGAKHLKKAFHQFKVADTIDWFEMRGVPLKIESDGRMFPKSNDSQTIINCLVQHAREGNIKIHLNAPISAIDKTPNGNYTLECNGKHEIFDKVIVATGGSPKMRGFEWIRRLGHSINSPVPSLFTFNLPKDPITALMGVVVESALVRIQGTKLKQSGPLLITHWGMSGPAILKLSAWGARGLEKMGYSFNVQVNWVSGETENIIREKLDKNIIEGGKRKVINLNPFGIPSRLWEFLLAKAGLDKDSTWNSHGKKNLNRLINVLTNDVYPVRGKTTFKEEFVTCGGINLSEVDFNTMESKINKGLYFAGEILDIDGITGGFNFQAAWTTGYIAGKLRSSG